MQYKLQNILRNWTKEKRIRIGMRFATQIKELHASGIS